MARPYLFSLHHAMRGVKKIQGVDCLQQRIAAFGQRQPPFGLERFDGLGLLAEQIHVGGGTADVAFVGHRPRHRQFDCHQHLHPAQAYTRSAIKSRLRTLAQKLYRGMEHVLVERLLLGNPSNLHQRQSRVDVGRGPQAHLHQRVHRPVLVQQHVHPIRHGSVRAGQGLADEAKRQAAILGQEQTVLGIVG